MNKYSLSAINAVKYYHSTPIAAWEKATMEIFGESESQKKSCPKSTFLGLCEEGLIKGIPRGNYTKSEKNKMYALSSLDILKLDKNNSLSPKELWNELNLGDKSHNSQMDVVLALWNANLIG